MSRGQKLSRRATEERAQKSFQVLRLAVVPLGDRSCNMQNQTSICCLGHQRPPQKNPRKGPWNDPMNPKAPTYRRADVGKNPAGPGASTAGTPPPMRERREGG